MPLEAAVLATREHTLDDLRALAETMSPPMLVRDTVHDGAITVTELDETPVATFGRPRRVETWVDVQRLYGAGLGHPGFLTEAVVPLAYRRGLALVFALEALLEGSAVVRGMES